MRFSDPGTLFRPACGAFLAVSAALVLLSPIGRHLYWFGFLYIALFGLLVLLVKTFPKEWPARKQWAFVLGFSLAVRLIFLSFPASWDVSRYVWEGAVLNKGFNPYLLPPDSPVLEPLRGAFGGVWETVNHKDLTACYPPLTLLVFRAAAWVSASALFFKILILSFDLGLIAVLGLTATRRGLPLSRVLLYALNPLVLVFIAGEGHLDAVQLFFLWLGFYFFSRGRDGPGFFSLGCAVVTKYFAAIAAPFLVRADNWKRSLWLPLAMIFFYLPFQGTGTRMFESLVSFGAGMHYNDSITALLRAVVGEHAVLAGAALLLVCCVIIFLSVPDWLRSSYLAAGCLLLLVTTLHPWYLTLVTPFLVFFPSRAWLYLHAAVVFTFPVLHAEYHTGVFQEIHWLKWPEYLPFYGLLLWDAWHATTLLPVRRFPPVRSISAVIPALDESQHLAQCLEAVHRSPSVTEIIVADGGSRDNTLDKAREGGALVLQAPKGRGSQIKRGIEASRGNLIWVLHADCVPKPGAAERILATLNERREMVGGALGMEFSGPGWKSGLIARLNNARARWAAIAFGDQGQFFRREVLPEMGGFPNMMLMEDVELSMRLKECGPVCFLPRGVVVSGRRWERKGFTGNTLRVLRLCAAYLVARRLGTASGRDRRFYELYYSASCEAESASPDDGSRTPAGVDYHNPQSGGDSFKEGRLTRPRLR